MNKIIFQHTLTTMPLLYVVKPCILCLNHCMETFAVYISAQAALDNVIASLLENEFNQN